MCLFVLLFYLVNVFFCVLCCLMFIDMFHIQMQLMQSLDQWNEYMYVCKRERYFVVELCYCHWIFMLERYVSLFEITCFCFHSLVVHTSRTHPCNLLLAERNQNFSLDEGMFQLDKMGGIQNYMGYAHL